MTQKIKSYRDLLVWQKAHELAKRVLDMCRQLPKTDEAKIIKAQIIRSATSVPANIAEGFGGNKGRVFQNSLTIARRETSETDYWLLLIYEENYIDKERYEYLERGYQEVRRMLSSMISKISGDF